MTRTDPRATRSRTAVLDAARALLQEEGPAAVTHQRVAARAGVGRATVYRHWPEPETLLHEAMSGVGLPFFTDFDADLRAWLWRELRRLADEMAQPTVRQVVATLAQAALRDPVARDRFDRWLEVCAQRLHAALVRAAERSEIDPAATAADPADVAARLLGPLVYRTLLDGGAVGDALLEQVIATVVPLGGGAGRDVRGPNHTDSRDAPTCETT